MPVSCMVCGDAIPLQRQGEDPVCFRSDCRFVAGQKGKMPAAAYAQFFALRSRSIRWQIQRERESEEKVKRARDREEAENRACWQAKTAAIPGFRAEKFPLLAVPRNPRKLANLPERRKRAFRDHLNQMIAAATALPHAANAQPTQPDAPPTAAKLLGGACALCKGACCLSGGNHAYLRTATLVRVMRAQPALRPRHILDLYLAQLGNKTYENACVYQGETGCVLPLELRSNVCTDYFCPPLQQFKAAFDGDEKPEGAFVVVRAREHWTFPNGPDAGIAGAYLLAENGEASKV